MEHHNIFSLEPNEIGCMDAAEHVIELLDTEPFKEWFHRIAPPLVEEVWEHLQEMLDGARSAHSNPRGVTWWSWYARRMGVSGSALISAG